tara:strand:+ start:639 stop:794 length:156 start_codon:yes stop_codon:yes gene_type:complete
VSVLADLQSRGVEDILIASVDGLKGFPDAIKTIFPKILNSSLYCSPDLKLS